MCGSAVKYTRVCFSNPWHHLNVSAFERFYFQRQLSPDFERFPRRQLALTSSILLQTLTSCSRNVMFTRRQRDVNILFWKIRPQYTVHCTGTMQDTRKCRAGNLLIRSSLICSFRSNQMSNCDRFAQVAQDKWATVSKSLKLLMTNERPWAIRSGCSW